MSLLLVFSLITLIFAAPLPQNDSDIRFTFTTPETFNFTFTTPTPANAFSNGTVANDAATVPVSTVTVPVSTVTVPVSTVTVPVSTVTASQETTMEVDTTVQPIALQYSAATVTSDPSVQSTDAPSVLLNLTTPQTDASVNPESSTTAPLVDQIGTTVVPVVQYDQSVLTPVILNDAVQTTDSPGTSAVPVVVLDGATVVPTVSADPTGTTPTFVEVTPEAPSLVQNTLAPVVLNSSDASINYVARDASITNGTTVIPILSDLSTKTVQSVPVETTMQPAQNSTMASINVVPIMADPSSSVIPVLLLDTTVAPLESFQTTEVPVVIDSSATPTSSPAHDVGRDVPVDPALSITTSAPVPVVNNGEELVSSMALPFGNITILQTIHITLSANQTADAPVVVPIVPTETSPVTNDSTTQQSIEDPVSLANRNPVLADPTQQILSDPVPVQDPSTLPLQPQISEQQTLPSVQQPQLDFVNYQQADSSYNNAYQYYLNLTETQAQHLVLNISLPVSPQNLLSRLGRTTAQMNYDGKLDVALQLTAMAHNLMSEVDSDLERRN